MFSFLFGDEILETDHPAVVSSPLEKVTSRSENKYSTPSSVTNLKEPLSYEILTCDSSSVTNLLFC